MRESQMLRFACIGGTLLVALGCKTTPPGAGASHPSKAASKPSFQLDDPSANCLSVTLSGLTASLVANNDGVYTLHSTGTVNVVGTSPTPVGVYLEIYCADTSHNMRPLDVMYF